MEISSLPKLNHLLNETNTSFCVWCIIQCMCRAGALPAAGKQMFSQFTDLFCNIRCIENGLILKENNEALTFRTRKGRKKKGNEQEKLSMKRVDVKYSFISSQCQSSLQFLPIPEPLKSSWHERHFSRINPVLELRPSRVVRCLSCQSVHQLGRGRLPWRRRAHNKVAILVPVKKAQQTKPSLSASLLASPTFSVDLLSILSNAGVLSRGCEHVSWSLTENARAAHWKRQTGIFFFSRRVVEGEKRVWPGYSVAGGKNKSSN